MRWPCGRRVSASSTRKCRSRSRACTQSLFRPRFQCLLKLRLSARGHSLDSLVVRTAFDPSAHPNPSGGVLNSLTEFLKECRKTCERRRLPQDEVDDIVQHLALCVLEGKCNDIRHRTAWLNGFVWRTLTRMRTRQSRVDQLLHEPAATEAAHDFAEPSELLRRLPARMRRALELRYLESRSTAESADELDMSPASYRVLCSRARAALRQ